MVFTNTYYTGYWLEFERSPSPLWQFVVELMARKEKKWGQGSGDIKASVYPGASYAQIMPIWLEPMLVQGRPPIAKILPHPALGGPA